MAAAADQWPLPSWETVARVLSANWVRPWDPNTGRFFYANILTEATSWYPPEVPDGVFPACEVPLSDEELRVEADMRQRFRAFVAARLLDGPHDVGGAGADGVAPLSAAATSSDRLPVGGAPLPSTAVLAGPGIPCDGGADPEPGASSHSEAEVEKERQADVEASQRLVVTAVAEARVEIILAETQIEEEEVEEAVPQQASPMGPAGEGHVVRSGPTGTSGSRGRSRTPPFHRLTPCYLCGTPWAGGCRRCNRPICEWHRDPDPSSASPWAPSTCRPMCAPPDPPPFAPPPPGLPPVGYVRGVRASSAIPPPPPGLPPGAYVRGVRASSGAAIPPPPPGLPPVGYVRGSSGAAVPPPRVQWSPSTSSTESGGSRSSSSTRLDNVVASWLSGSPPTADTWQASMLDAVLYRDDEMAPLPGPSMPVVSAAPVSDAGAPPWSVECVVEAPGHTGSSDQGLRGGLQGSSGGGEGDSEGAPSDTTLYPDDLARTRRAVVAAPSAAAAWLMTPRVDDDELRVARTRHAAHPIAAWLWIENLPVRALGSRTSEAVWAFFGEHCHDAPDRPPPESPPSDGTPADPVGLGEDADTL